METLPARVQICGGAALGASVTMNIALLQRESTLRRIEQRFDSVKLEIFEAMKKDRHEARGELTAFTMGLGLLRDDFKDLIALKFADLVGKLPTKVE